MSDLLTGPVEVVGAGLLGTSIALACRRVGLDAVLSDLSAENLRTASGLGAGRARQEADRPQLVVVAEDALAEGRVVVGDPTERDTIPLVVPIRLRGQLLGAVEWEVPQDEFDLNKIQLAQNLTDQLAVNLENARLFQESQRATQRERLVNEIASRLTSQNDIDHILQTAVREVGMALRSPQVSVRLSQTSHSNGSNGHKVADVDDETQSRSESI